jgi:hypothetical protein
MSLHLTPSRATAGAVVLLLFAAAPAAAAPWRQRHPDMALAAAQTTAAPGAMYGGHTSQDDPFAIQVTRGGRALNAMLIRIDPACDDGNRADWSGASRFLPRQPATPPADIGALSPARLARDGRFAANGSATASYGDGIVGTLRQTVRGRLRRGKGRGTYSATLDIVEQASGKRLASCRTGSLRWTARSAPGRTYAGITSQAQPVVVQRTPNGRRVSDLWISYSAPCQSGETFSIGDPLIRFPVSHGRFGDVWTDGVDLDQGGRRLFDYDLTGTVGASTATGAIQVVVKDLDATGNQTDVCDTTPLTWKAVSTKGASSGVSRRPALRRVG